MSLCTESQCLVCSFVSYNTNSNTDGVLSSIHTSYSPCGEGIDEIRGWRECVCALEPLVQKNCTWWRSLYNSLCILYIWVSDGTLIFVRINKVTKKYTKMQFIQNGLNACIHVWRPCLSFLFRSNGVILKILIEIYDQKRNKMKNLEKCFKTKKKKKCIQVYSVFK